MAKAILPQNQPQGKTPIQVLAIYPKRVGNLKALATVQVGALEIRGFRIVQQQNQKAFCQWPLQQGADNNGWWPAIKCHSDSLDERVKQAVMEVWQDTQGGAA